MRGWLRSTIIPLLFVFIVAAPVSAGVIYCKNDPVVQLNGTLVDISIDIPLEYVPKVDGPIRYEIQTHPSVQRAVILNDGVGYGHGSEVVFKDGAGAVEEEWFPVKINVEVPIDTSQLESDEVVPAQLTIIPANGELLVVEGTSEQTSIKFKLKGS